MRAIKRSLPTLRSKISCSLSRVSWNSAAVVSLLMMVVALSCAAQVSAQTAYQKPPKEILDVLNAPPTPIAVVSPSRDVMLLAQGVRYPPIADLAQPMLRLAGVRINPNTNGPHRAQYFMALTLKKISDGSEMKITLPANVRAGMPSWSPDGKRFAFTNTTPTGIELWVGDTASGKVSQLKGVVVNAAYGDPFDWMPDSRTLLVHLVPSGRGKMPAPPTVPTGPTIQESSGKNAPVRTFEDLLKNPYDEQLFEFYATSQLAFVDAASGRITNVGAPAIFQQTVSAPDGEHLLVVRLHKPFSYLLPAFAFPKDVEVWDRAAKVMHKLASLPLEDEVPIEGVPKGPRAYHWRPNEPATLVWVEALDEGNPKNKVPHRDRVLVLKAPFTGQPTELTKLTHRYNGIQWGEKNGVALISEYDRNRRWVTTYLLNVNNPSQAPKQIWSMSQQERYKNPGTPMQKTLPTGHRAMIQDGDWIFLNGTGASPEGDRPFLDRFNLQTGKTERLFRSDAESYETAAALLSDDGRTFITRRERPIEPLNYYVRTVKAGGNASSGDGMPSDLRALTKFPDLTPQLRGIKKQLVKYKRADGVDLSFTLYLPPGYKEGTRLPTVVWAYPLEFNDPDTAGQVTGSTQRYTAITGYSHLFFLLEGYAVLDNATMPIVGDPETMNNTYIEQIVASAKAAIDKAVEMGVTDPERVGVGGHSYGAFMTANLLAHSDLFRAGIARSGAYNRTLTPFGFQSERRTIWEAPELYMKVSPFLYANKINEPLLLIHGEADDNSGTFPIQSERMYAAIRGNGGSVRLVMLPLEAHGYTSRETTEHVLYEMVNWFDKYVKHAPPRSNKQVSEMR